MCSGSEVGSYLRLIDFVYHSTLGLRVTVPTRWTTDLSSKVNLPGTINFKALCGTELVTLSPRI